MRQTFFILGLSILFFASCKKEASSISVSGIYTENSPVAGRTQLIFTSSKQVIKIEIASSYKDTFNYSLTGGKILLTQIRTNPSLAQPFDFEKIDNNTIKIQNLLPGLPEAPNTYMTFIK